jgi:hypothetical protein
MQMDRSPDSYRHDASMRVTYFNHYTIKVYFFGANFEGATWVNGDKCQKGSIGKCLHK